jgi:hypothetical protein
MPIDPLLGGQVERDQVDRGVVDPRRVIKQGFFLQIGTRSEKVELGMSEECQVQDVDGVKEIKVADGRK